MDGDHVMENMCDNLNTYEQESKILILLEKFTKYSRDRNEEFCLQAR